MKKCNHKTVISILFVLAFALTAISSCRASEINFSNLIDSALDNIRGYLKETGQESFSINNDVKIPATPEFISWNGQQNVYAKGGIDVQFKGHKLTVKLGFIRGGFDSYTQTYKTEPGITVHYRGRICVYVSRGQSVHQRWPQDGATFDINIKFHGQTVEISDYTNSSERVTVSYNELLSKWLSFGSAYCVKHFGKTYYFVPQRLWKDGYWHYGWVVSENTPLYYTTNMPQDFVELFRGHDSYKPKAYSLPLRLTFVLSPTQKNVWEIRQMTDEEAGDIIMNESENYKSGVFVSSFPTATESGSITLVE